ncbi:MAG: B12-binding domain-containing radical SAM protein [Thermodesulfobacteriota bacterium]
MHYEGNIIRPPSEADSILLQVCVSCPHNTCAFCGAYLDERFRVKDDKTVFADIDYAASRLTGMRRVFLCDGDAMILPMERLSRILGRIRERIPRVSRTASYASARSVAAKSPGDLARLREMGLAMVYMGLESGDDALLERMNKKASVASNLEAARKVREAGMKLSVTVITGLAGTQGWERHARLTGEALTAMRPDHVAALSLIPVPGTPLWEDIRTGRFELHGARGMTLELRTLLQHVNLERGLFLADHASNHVPLKLRLPRDKEHGLRLLDAALDGRLPFKPERSRGL